MATPEAKELYKLRKQTVERGFADGKEQRAFRRFGGRGLARAEAPVGLLVLAANLVALVSLLTKLDLNSENKGQAVSLYFPHESRLSRK